MRTPPEEHKFKKGQSGNLNGRPKGTLNKSTIIKKFLEAIQKAENPISGKDEDMTIQDRMVLAQIQKALKGDTKAFKELMDGAYGMNKQVIEQWGEVTQTIIERKIVKGDS
jgi:hypothetical protein